MNGNSPQSLTLYFQKSNCFRVFFPMLQNGFRIFIPSETKIRRIVELYCTRPAEEVIARIQTLFLNGKPVDDLNRTMVKNGDCLALSAAMPGLVGATMRAGGLLAGFRKGISHIADPGRPSTQNGLVCIKLFNLLIKEMGPDFLNKGIFLSPAELMSLAEDIQSSCATSLPATVWDNESIDFEHLGTVHLPGAADPIFMRATFDSPP